MLPPPGHPLPQGKQPRDDQRRRFLDHNQYRQSRVPFLRGHGAYPRPRHARTHRAQPQCGYRFFCQNKIKLTA